MNTLITPMVAYEINLYTAGTTPFSVTEMLRFRNMFAKNIVHGNWPDLEFYNAVNGYDYSVYGDNITPGMFKYVVPAYMPLYKFDYLDNSPLPVYDIIMNFFSKDIYPANKNINVSGGMMDMGCPIW